MVQTRLGIWKWIFEIENMQINLRNLVLSHILEKVSPYIFHLLDFFSLLKVSIWLAKIVYCVKGARWSLRQFLVTENPLKLMENALYFTLKALFVFKVFKFLSWHFGYVEKRLDEQDKVNSKIMTSQPGKQTIAKHILPDTSRNKGNRTWEHKNITWETFLFKNHIQNVVEKHYETFF